MKIRTSFVSNSSSTSFCVIGTGNHAVIGQFATQMNKFFHGYEDYLPDRKLKTVRCCEHPEQDFPHCPICGKPMWKEPKYDWDEYDYPEWWADRNDGVFFYGGEEVYTVGMNAEELLQTMSIPQAKEHFVKIAKEKFRIDVPLKSVYFEYGEYSSG